MRATAWFAWLVLALFAVFIAERYGFPPRVALVIACLLWLLLLLAVLGVL